MKTFVRSGRAELCVEDTPADSLHSESAVVCLHAGVCDKRMWAAQRDALRSKHRVLAYDRRGFGETRYAPETYSRVGDLLSVIDASHIDRAVLMGCSQGGRIAIDAALAYPERVRALVLVACSVSGGPADADGPFEPGIQARIDALEAAEARADLAALNELEAQVWLDGPAQPARRIDGRLRELFLAMNGIALAAPDPGEATEPPSAWARLDEIRVPVLLMWGTLDFAHFEARMRELERRIPAAQAFPMQGVAHLPNLEQPDRFNAAVARFLSTLQRRDG